MKYLGRKKSSNPGQDIDMSGMMDIIFILLIFLMVFLSFDKTKKAISLDLPNTERGSSSKKENINISVKVDGEIYLDKKKVSIKEIKEIADSGNFNQKIILLNIDKKAEYQYFIDLYTVLQKTNPESINLGVKK